MVADLIREATHADIPAIMAMGRRFADDAGVTREVGWDDESVRNLLVALIDNEDGVLLVCDAGMIGGVVYAHPFNNSCRVFQEMFWRSEGREGLRLLEAAEDAARQRGAERSIMLGMDSLPRLDRLYSRKGYAPTERSYIKEI